MKKIKKLLSVLGPGFITGASDDDPSGIGTYSQTGATFGYHQLWTSLFCLPFMTVVQEMCGRIGLVTGKGIAGVVRHHYSKTVLYIAVFLLLIANTVNIGANLGAMAESAEALLHIPFTALLIIMTVTTLLLEVFVSYRVYSRYLKYLALALLTYVVCAFVINLNWKEALTSTVFPRISFSKEYLLNIVAILGTTISPYLFFWQAGEEVEEEVLHKRLKTMGQGIPKIFPRDIKNMRFDTIAGMFFSQIIMFFIIATTAATLNKNGITSIQTADQAAQALRPLVGDFAYLFFAMGIIGTGLLAVPILAGSASYALSEAFGWREGLYQKFSKAHGFYAVITIATLIGLLINFTPINPFQMLYYTAVLNGVIAPPLLILILFIANNKNIMGKYTNNKWANVLGVIIALVMSVCAILLLVSLLGII